MRTFTNLLLILIIAVAAFFAYQVSIANQSSNTEQPTQTSVTGEGQASDQELMPQHHPLSKDTVYQAGRFTVTVVKGLYEIEPSTWQDSLSQISTEYLKKIPSGNVLLTISEKTNRVGTVWDQSNGGGRLIILVSPSIARHPTCLDYLVGTSIIRWWEEGGAYSEQGPYVTAALYLQNRRLFKGIDFVNKNGIVPWQTAQVQVTRSVISSVGEIGRNEAFMYSPYYDSSELQFYVPAGTYTGIMIPSWKVESELPNGDFFFLTKAEIYEGDPKEWVFIWEGYLEPVN